MRDLKRATRPFQSAWRTENGRQLAEWVAPMFRKADAVKKRVRREQSWGPEPPRSNELVIGGEVLDLQQPPAKVDLILTEFAGSSGEAATPAFEPGKGPFDGVETLRQEGIFGLIDDRVYRLSPYQRNADEEAGTALRRPVRDRASGRLTRR